MSWDFKIVQEPPAPPEPPDLTSIESTVVQTVIQKARECKRDPLELKYRNNATELLKALEAAMDTGVLVETLREAVRYSVLRGIIVRVVTRKLRPFGYFSRSLQSLDEKLLTTVLHVVTLTEDNVLRCSVIGELLTQAKATGMLSYFCDYFLRNNISPVTAAAKCGLLPDVLRGAIDCKKVIVGIVTSGVIEEVQARGKEDGFSPEVVEDCHRWSTSLIQVAIKCGLLTNVLGEAVVTGNMARILKGAIAGTLLENLLTAAKNAGLLFYVVIYCLRNTIYPIALLREAVRYGMLRKIVAEFTRRSSSRISIYSCQDEYQPDDGVSLINVLKAVKQTEDNALRCTLLAEILTQAKKSGTFSFVVKSCLTNNISPVTAAAKCGLLPDVLGVAVDCEVMKGIVACGVIEEVQTRVEESRFSPDIAEDCHNWDASLIQVAIKCGLLTEVLVEAALTGHMARTLDAAIAGNLLDDVLIVAKKSGLLSSVVKYCLRNNIFPTIVLRGAVRYEVLREVLAEVTRKQWRYFHDEYKPAEIQLLVNLLKAVNQTGDIVLRYTVMVELLAQANVSGTLSFVVKYCLRNNFSPTIVLREAIRYEVLGIILADVTRRSRFSIFFLNFESNYHPIDGELLINILEAVKQTEDHTLTCTVIEELLTQAQKSKTLSTVVKICLECSISPVTAAVKCDLLCDVLTEAVQCGDVMTGPVTFGVIEEVQARAKEAGFSPEMVEDCHRWSASLIQVAIKCGLLTNVLGEAVVTGNMARILDGAISGSLLQKVFSEAKKSALLSIVVENSFCNNIYLTRARMGAVMSFVVRKIVAEVTRSSPSQKTMANLENGSDSVGRQLRVSILKEVGQILDNILIDQQMLEETERLNEMFEVLHAIIAFILLLCFVSSGRTRRTSHCSSEHRKCITDHMTLCSGDIERNPGPVFFFNDWLKEMFALSVRIVHGIEGKRIPWKKYGRPDPSNSKLDRKGLQKLFDRTLLQAVETRIPVTHSEEFQMLQAYIYNDQEPDLDRLEILVSTRKLMTSLKKNLEDFKSMPSEIQQLINSHLRRENLGFDMMNTNTEAVGNVENDDGGVPIMDREQIRECEGEELMEREEGPTVEGAETIEGAPTMQQQDVNATIEDKSGQEIQMPYLPVTAPAVLDDQEETMSNDIEDLHQIDKNREVYLNIVSPFWSGIDLTDVDGLLDSLERCGVDLGDLGQLDESGAGQYVSASGDGEILQDPMERILDQVESTGSRPEKDPNLLKLQIESDEGGTSESEEPPGPCRDDVTDSSTQQSDLDSDVNLELALLKKRHETLLLNFERFTGLKNSDTREYNLDDNELTELRALSRKRRARSDLSGEEVSKWSRFQ